MTALRFLQETGVASGQVAGLVSKVKRSLCVCGSCLCLAVDWSGLMVLGCPCYTDQSEAGQAVFVH